MNDFKTLQKSVFSAFTTCVWYLKNVFIEVVLVRPENNVVKKLNLWAALVARGKFRKKNTDTKFHTALASLKSKIRNLTANLDILVFHLDLK